MLYSSYEAQAEAHLAGHVDVTWDSPLAWVRTRRLADGRRPRRLGPWRCATPTRTSPRSCSCGPTATSPRSPQLAGGVVGTGAVDSPQATLLPLAHLAGLGLDPGTSFDRARFDVMVTKHGDHVGGERDAVKALVDGDVDAACVIDGNQLLFAKEGTIADRRGAGVDAAPRRTTTAR